MSTIVNYFGDDDFFSGGSAYANLKDPSPFLSLRPHFDAYYPPLKRSRISAPFVFQVQQKKSSIEVLPDECLFEIFRRLPGGQERSVCASVSKRWLMLLSSINKVEISGTAQSNKVEKGFDLNKEPTVDESANDTQEVESDGCLTRSLEGKKATDIRLAAISVGNGNHGGLAKLVIKGTNSTRGVTNVGLSAIGHGCPSLKVLSLWNVPSVGDEGLIAIANGCHKLEKLDLTQCPTITDKALFAIAENCPNLASITIVSCSKIGNDGLRAIGRGCPNLQCITIKDCPLVGDQGVASLISSASFALLKVNLQGLNVTDVSLAVIGHYGKNVTDLVLTGLQNVKERGFWVMGNANGLQKLKSIKITSCGGVTDLALQAVGNGCPNLKQLCLTRCSLVSDNGFVAFARAATALESLQLEECNSISQSGVLVALSNCKNLKSLGLVKCTGIKDIIPTFPLPSSCESLRSLSIRNCSGFTNSSLAMVGKICPRLQYVDLSGLCAITDAGFLPLLETCKSGLVKVNLSGCMNVTDAAICALANFHGESLQTLNLDGCRKISNTSLIAVAEKCSLLKELDVSKCAITDSGIASLSCAKKLELQILSLSGCSLVSDKSLPHLAKIGKSLFGLNLQHCNSISNPMIMLLVEHLWRCDILA